MWESFSGPTIKSSSLSCLDSITENQKNLCLSLSGESFASRLSLFSAKEGARKGTKHILLDLNVNP